MDTLEWAEPILPYLGAYFLLLLVLWFLFGGLVRRVRRGGIVRGLMRLVFCLLRSTFGLLVLLLALWVLASFGIFTGLLNVLGDLPVISINALDFSFSLAWIIILPVLLLVGVWVLRRVFGCFVPA